jgi:glycosidase
VTCGNSNANAITQCWQAVEDIRDHMLNFLENHDEQRIASDFFAGEAERGRAPLLVSACMWSNPMMIYFGQELGEKGMDSEGFSGEDGRTTIFDYWTVETIRRWRNNGKFDGKQLTNAEQSLRQFYQTVLTLCNKEQAIREGQFYDIMYANYENQEMDTNRQYAFLRKSGKSLILVIANFDHNAVHTKVRIPAAAFTHLGIPTDKGMMKVKDLLSGKTEEQVLSPDGMIETDLEGSYGKVLKFRL